MKRLATEGWKSGLSRKRRKNSYTSCRCGQAASRVGSSSSGSNSAAFGFSGGGSVRKRLIPNMLITSGYMSSVMTLRFDVM